MKEFLAKYINKTFTAKKLSILAGIDENLLSNYKNRRSGPRGLTVVYICMGLDLAQKQGLIEIDRGIYPNEISNLDILYMDSLRCLSRE